MGSNWLQTLGSLEQALLERKVEAERVRWRHRFFYASRKSSPYPGSLV